MPKLKTHKGAASRYRTTGTGKIVRMKRESSHLRRKKPKAVRRLYKVTVLASKGESRRVRRLVPSLNL